MPLQRELDAIVTDTMTPTLSALGFSHRRPMDFLRMINEGLVQILSVQVSAHASPTFTSFTLNVGFFAPEFFEIRGLSVPDRIPEADACHCSGRLGSIVPKRSSREFWYDLGNDGVNLRLRSDEYATAGYDPQKPWTLRALINSDLEMYVAPFLEPLRDRRQLLDACREKRVLFPSAFELLALMLATGETGAACRLFQTALADRQRVWEWSVEKYQVDLRTRAD